MESTMNARSIGCDEEGAIATPDAGADGRFVCSVLSTGVYRSSRVGRVLVATTSRGVCTVALGDADEALFDELRTRFPRARIEGADDRAAALAARVVAIIDARANDDAIPLDLVGTAFQRRVWRELRAIAAGETTTYSAIARRIGAPKAVRAVGSACGKNPVAVVVPCHRVLRQDGSLGGYRWGLERKRDLLAFEAAQAASIG